MCYSYVQAEIIADRQIMSIKKLLQICNYCMRKTGKIVDSAAILCVRLLK